MAYLSKVSEIYLSGSDVHLRVFYANEYELDGIELVAKMAWRRPNIEEDWEGYLYGLEFVEISSKDHEELIKLVNRQLPSEEMPERGTSSVRIPLREGWFFFVAQYAVNF